MKREPNVSTRAALRMAIMAAALLAPWMCQAQPTQTLTSTFSGGYQATTTSTSLFGSGCSSLPKPNWTPTGAGFQLTTSVSSCGSIKVTAGIQINVTISPATITGFVVQQVGYSNSFYLTTPLTIDVTANVTPTGNSSAPHLDLYFNSIGGRPEDLTQCGKWEGDATSAHLTCSLTGLTSPTDYGASLARDYPSSPTHDSFVANVTVTVGGPSGTSVGGGFHISPQFTEGAGGSDSISLSNVTPASGSALDPQSSQQFTGTAQYTLLSAASGTVTLELSDQNGAMIGSSPAVNVSKGASSTPLTIPAVTLPSTGSLSLKAVLRPAGGAATSSTAVNYTIGCPAPAAPSGSKSAGASCASISLDVALPQNANPLAATAVVLPPFCGAGKYSYSGTLDTAGRTHQGQLRLELLDGNDNTIAHTDYINVANGSNQSWGGGCTDKKQLVFIPEQPMPSFPIPPGTPLDKVLGVLRLQAALYDTSTGATVATSNQVPYNVVPGVSATSHLETSVGFSENPDWTTVDPSRPVGPTYSRETVDLADAETGEDHSNLSLVVSLDLAGSGGQLDAKIDVMNGAGNFLPRGVTTRSQAVITGHNDVRLPVYVQLVPLAARVSIQPRFTSDGGQVILLDKIDLTIDSLAVLTLTPDPAKCSISTPGSCLTLGQSNTIEAQLSITPAASGQQYGRTVSIKSYTKNSDDVNRLALNPPPTASEVNLYSDSFQTAPPEDSYVVYILYGAAGGAKVLKAYGEFASPVLEMLANGANSAKQILNFAGGLLNDAASAAARRVRNLKTNINLALRFKNAGTDLDNWLKGKINAADASTTFIPIQTTWQFDPPIPHDGSFSASISLKYSAADLPDDPNFAESKLQVVSLDASGAFHVYPSTLDLANKIATAQIDGLDPYYSLAVVGPFNLTPVLLASPGTGYALVNTGTQSASVNITAYASDGTGAPSTATLQAGNRQTAAAAAWVQAWSNPSTVAGVSFFDNGSQFAVNPSQAAGQAFVLTDVEYDTRLSTQVDIVNTTPFAARTTITLYDSDGSVQGTFTNTLAAKGSLSGRFEGLFPSIKAGFRGYATIASLQPIAVSGYQWTNTWATGLAVQSVTGDSLALRSWYAPQLGASGTVATLHVVNTGSTAANITLKAFSASGSPAAANVNVQLAAGQEYAKAVSDIFVIDPSTAGSIEVDSDTNGVFSDVLTVDSSFIARYAVSLPLTAQPMTSLVLPYATSNTSVYIFNPNSTAANVTVTPYSATGAAGSPSSASVPGFGRTAIAVTSSGYATIGSTQPVVASGWIVVPSGATAGYLALPSSAAANILPPGGGVPKLSLSSNSLAFGNVNVGQTKDLSLIVSNTGSAALTVISATVTGTGFSLTSASSFTVQAGASQTMTVRFAPASMNAASGTLIIASNDPSSPASVSLSGTGVAAVAPAISITPTSLDFGAVAVGQTKDLTFAVFNNGNAALNVTALTAAAPFSVVSPAPPISVPAGASSTVTVRFAPAVAGTQSGALSIASNDAAMPSVIVNLTGSGVTGGGTLNISRTLVYHEITLFAKQVRFGNGGQPVLSATGNRIVYANAPGDETDARYNDIFVVNSDGSGQRQVDSYKQNCYCSAVVDISADGNTVVSTDSIELRIASATGSTGKRLITNREISYVRISPKGDKVFFIHRRGDASASDTTTERGLYVINTDGSGLKQVAGPKAVASLLGITADKVFPFATNGWSLDVSADGTKLVFGLAAPGGERIFTVNADGTGLRQVLGPVDFVNHAALSGDGTKVGYDIIPPPCCSTPNEVGVINYDGSGRKALATNVNAASGLRIQMSNDGSKLLHGTSNRLFFTDGSGAQALSVRGGYFSSDPAVLVTDGFNLAMMNAAADRFVYSVADDAGVQQIATLDINPANLGEAPAISSQNLSQASIALSGANQSTISAAVKTANKVTRVSAAILNAGVNDPEVNAPVMLDDGTSGDEVAGDGIYTSNAVRADCCAALGPRTVRVKAEVRDSGNRMHATAIEFGGLTVVSKAP